MESEIRTNMEKILTGKLTYKSQNLAFNMMISRMQMKLKSEPGNFDLCMNELDEFAAKYPSVIQVDYDRIACL